MITSTPTGRPESGLVEAGQIPSGIRTVRGSRQRRDEVGGQQGDDLGPASGSMLSRYPAPGRQRADDQVFFQATLRSAAVRSVPLVSW